MCLCPCPIVIMPFAGATGRVFAVYVVPKFLDTLHAQGSALHASSLGRRDMRKQIAECGPTLACARHGVERDIRLRSYCSFSVL